MENATKICQVCNNEKDIQDFKGKTGKFCSVCRKIRNKISKSKYETENRDEIRDRKKNWRNQNPDKVKESKLKSWPKYYKQNKEDIARRRAKAYYSNNYEIRIKQMLQSAEKRARKINVIFDLDFNYLITLYQSQHGKCAVTGLNFVLEKQGNYSRRPFAPSLDRINNSEGYTKDNVRLVCTIVNLSLSEFGDKVFDQMCESYMNNKNK